jgi:hypothetical protein
MAPPSKWAEVIQKASQANRPPGKGDPSPAAEAAALAKAAAAMASIEEPAGDEAGVSDVKSVEKRHRSAKAAPPLEAGSRADALTLRVRQALASRSAPSPAARAAGGVRRVQSADPVRPAPPDGLLPPPPAPLPDHHLPVPPAAVPSVVIPSTPTLGWLARLRRWLGFARR